MKRESVCPKHRKPLILGAPSWLFGEYCIDCCKLYVIQIPGKSLHGVYFGRPDTTTINPGSRNARIIPIPFSFRETLSKENVRDDIRQETCVVCHAVRPITSLFSGDEVSGYHCVECVVVNKTSIYPENWIRYAQGAYSGQQPAMIPSVKYYGPPEPKKPTPHLFSEKLMGGIVEMCKESRGNLLTLWQVIQAGNAPPMHHVDAQEILALCTGAAMHRVRYAELIAYAQEIIQQTDLQQSVAAE